jgi:hypothetical protein
MVIQRTTQRPKQFKLTERSRVAVAAWLEKPTLRGDQFLFEQIGELTQVLTGRMRGSCITGPKPRA